jgi:predicted RNase H-like nuclease (RuvC/YqgF family)
MIDALKVYADNFGTSHAAAVAAVHDAVMADMKSLVDSEVAKQTGVDVGALTAKADALTAANADLTNSKFAMQATIDSQAAQLATLTTVAADNAALKADVVDREATIAQLQNELADMVNELNSIKPALEAAIQAAMTPASAIGATPTPAA